MASIISRCVMCGDFFDSKKQLREHIDIHHRITNSKMAAVAKKKEWLTKKETFLADNNQK
jgi:uncharacterized C2H2 Zn-finger protein